jgi:prolyl-tRNA synthetase
MGCYGIGVGRTLAAIIEEYNDKYGIKWPVSVAPFTVEIIPLNMSDSEIRNEAEKLYKLFKERNIETIIDDRDDISAGVKFNDADLTGIPFQVIVGRTFKQNGKIEIKKRETGEKFIVEEQDAIKFIENIIKEN